VRIRVTHSEILVDVVAHFERAGFVVRVGGEESILDVRGAYAPSPEQERREIEMHLRVWRAMHPDRGVEVLEDGAQETPPTGSLYRREPRRGGLRPSPKPRLP
jgi:hypothetical protein